MAKPTQIVATRIAYQGYVTVTLATMRAPDGSTHTREVEHHGRAACVLPYDPDRRARGDRRSRTAPGRVGRPGRRRSPHRPEDPDAGPGPAPAPPGAVRANLRPRDGSGPAEPRAACAVGLASPQRRRSLMQEERSFGASPLVAADKVQGRGVFNLQGDKLGSIKDIYLDKISGQV